MRFREAGENFGVAARARGRFIIMYPSIEWPRWDSGVGQVRRSSGTARAEDAQAYSSCKLIFYVLRLLHGSPAPPLSPLYLTTFVRSTWVSRQ